MQYSGPPAYSGQYPILQYPVATVSPVAPVASMAPVIVVARRYGDWYPRTYLNVLGAFLLFLGIGSIITGALAINSGLMGQGAFCGVFAIAAGSVAMGTSRRPENNSMMKATAAMSFIAFLVSLPQIGTAIFFLVAAINLLCDLSYFDFYPTWCAEATGFIPLFAFDLAFASLTSILGLWLFIIVCKAICISSASAQAAPIPLKLYPPAGPFYPSIGMNQMAPVVDIKGY